MIPIHKPKFALPQPFTTQDLFEKVVEANKCVSSYIRNREAGKLSVIIGVISSIVAFVFPSITAPALTCAAGCAFAAVGFNYLMREAQDDIKDYELILFRTTYNRSDAGNFYACEGSNTLLRIDRETDAASPDERRFIVYTQ